MIDARRTVFPAYAGMSRKPTTHAHRNHGFPRLRGDEPHGAKWDAENSEFSPPTRG